MSENARPTTHALFAGNHDAVSWNDFTAGMDRFTISSTERRCNICDNTDGVCAAYASDDASNGDSSASPSSKESQSGNGLSPVLNGVIGVMALAGTLGLEVLALLVDGYRIVNKGRLRLPFRR